MHELVHGIAFFRQPSGEFTDNPGMFDHEKLDVYRCALEFFAQRSPVVAAFPRGHGAISDQFRRAPLSIPLNIAEACGKTAVADRQRFFAIARGSAMECAALLDVCELLELIDIDRRKCAKQHLLRIVQMLSRLSR